MFRIIEMGVPSGEGVNIAEVSVQDLNARPLISDVNQRVFGIEDDSKRVGELERALTLGTHSCQKLSFG